MYVHAVMANICPQGMEKQRVENRDGSEEAIMAKTNPFAIVGYTLRSFIIVQLPVCAFTDRFLPPRHTNPPI